MNKKAKAKSDAELITFWLNVGLIMLLIKVLL